MRQLDFINARLKYFAFLLLLCCSFSAFAQFPAPYCANAFPAGVEPITLVNFAGIENATTAVVGAAASPAHEDFTSMIGYVNAGSSYQIFLNGNTDGGWTNTFIVYIDWNQNGSFTDDGETYTMGTINSYNGTTSTPIERTIAVPGNALAGTTRMRVLKKFGTTALPSCYNGAGDTVAYGQSEDYSLEVTVPSCVPPTATNTALTSVSATFTWTAVSNATGYEYVLDNSATAPQGAGTPTTELSVTDNGLEPVTTYYFHIRTNCGNGFSDWITRQFKTLIANDTCDTAIDLGGEVSPLSGTTVGSTNDNLTTCLNAGGTTANTHGDVYYSIVVANGSTLSIKQTLNDYDSSNVVFYGDCTNRTQIDCFDDDDYKAVNWSNNTGADQTVYWIQDGHGGTGTFTLAWSVVACTPAAATFAVNSLCPGGSDEFEVVTTITSLGSATSVTVYDDQGNSETVSTTGPVVLGPYANSTPVIVKVINDQNPDCEITSSTLNQTVCPPANDNCSGAEQLTVNEDLECGVVTPGTVAGASASVVTGNTCFGNADDDVWYSFVATSTLHRIRLMNVTGSATDMYHSLWTGDDCNALTLVTGSCSDADTSTIGSLVVGQTYYVRVYTYTATAGQNTTFNICIGTPPPPPPPPANDNCSGAEELTVNDDFACGSVTAGTVAGATASTVTGNTCFGTADDDVWYSFVATSTSHRIQLTGVAGSVTDMYHSLWTGDCNALTLVTGSCSDADTSNRTGLTIGQAYYVRVYTYTGTAGQNTTFNICIGTPPPPPPPPANDDCSGAAELTVNDDFACGSVTAGTVAGATASTVTGNTCSGTADDDVWYSFVATSTSHRIQLTGVAGSVVDMYHSLWTGDCGALTLVAGSCSDADTSNRTGLTIGQTYYVRVYTYTATAGQNTTFNICIGTPPAPPANDACSSPTALTAGGTFAANAIQATNESATKEATDPVPSEACDGVNFATTGKDVWFSVVVPDSGTVTVETGTATGLSLTDTGMQVFSGSCGELTLLGCNADISATAPINRFSRVALVDLTPGDILLARVYGFNGTSGSFMVSAYDSSLSIPTSENTTFKAYPNPVRDELNLSFSQNMTDISIFNILGQKVLTKKVNATEDKIDMSNLAAGTYLVKVMVDNGVKTIKVVKQ